MQSQVMICLPPVMSSNASTVVCVNNMSFSKIHVLDVDNDNNRSRFEISEACIAMDNGRYFSVYFTKSVVW